MLTSFRTSESMGSVLSVSLPLQIHSPPTFILSCPQKADQCRLPLSSVSHTDVVPMQKILVEWRHWQKICQRKENSIWHLCPDSLPSRQGYHNEKSQFFSPFPFRARGGNRDWLLLAPECYTSVQSSPSVVSDSLRPCGLQHTRLPCPSPTPGVYSNSCPSSP